VKQALANPKVSVSALFVATNFMNVMDVTIVNVALPRIATQFHVSVASTGTIAVGYLVSLAVFIPAAGWIADRFGTKLVYILALGLFTVASGLCGLADSLGELIAFRILQGVGGGIMIPVGLAMLYRTFPSHERMRVSRILVIPTAVAPAVGPVVGGFLVDTLSWRWIFWVNLPVGLVACAFGLLYLREWRAPRLGPFDLWGFVLAALGLATLMYALSEGAIEHWSSLPIVAALVISVVALVLFVHRELVARAPMLDLRLLAERMFRSATTVMMLAFGAFFGVLFVLPLQLQDGLRFSALQSGLTTFPEAVGVVISSQLLVGWLYPRVGPRRLVTAGCAALAVLSALLGLIGAGTNIWLVRGVIFLLGCSVPSMMLPLQTAAFANVSQTATAAASSVYSAARQVAGAAAVALLSTVLASVGTSHRNADSALVPNLDAYHAALWSSAVIAACAGLAALTLRDSDAASTMRTVAPADEAA
jgi:EmrB/QacA subfamily drug resistance transporter